MTGEVAEIIERRRDVARFEVDGVTRIVQFIFHRNGQPVGRFNKSWATACVAAGFGAMVCPKCKASGFAHTCENCKVEARYVGKIFHDLRRSACRLMTQAGIQQAVAMRISGHKTDSVWRRYTLPTNDDVREGLAKAEKYRETTRKQKVVAIG